MDEREQEIGQEGYDVGYSEGIEDGKKSRDEEIKKAVQDERYSSIVELERILEKEANEYADMEYIQGVEDCLEAIRARANK